MIVVLHKPARLERVDYLKTQAHGKSPKDTINSEITNGTLKSQNLSNAFIVGETAACEKGT